jgi:hypothetical protein
MCTVRSANVRTDAFTYISDAQQAAVTLRPDRSSRSLGATCQQSLRQTFKWSMRPRQGLCRHTITLHTDRHNKPRLIKSLYSSELMNFQTN